MLIGEAAFSPEPQTAALAGKLYSLGKKTARNAPIGAALKDLGGFLDELDRLADPVTVSVMLTKRDIDAVALQLGIIPTVSAAGVVPLQVQAVYPWYRQTIAQAEITFDRAITELDGVCQMVTRNLLDRFNQDPIRFFGTEALYEELWRQLKEEGISKSDMPLAMVRRSELGVILIDMHMALVEAGEIKNKISNDVLPLVETTLQIKSPSTFRE